jgi:small-conductance mechanosensitive channel
MVDYGQVAIGIGVLSLTILIEIVLFYVLRRCCSRHNHMLQLILTLLFTIGLVISVYEAFGYDMAASLLTGIGLAVGLALQPMMKKVIAGIAFDVILEKDAQVECNGIVGKVLCVGVVHTTIETSEGKVSIHNDYFNTHPVTITNGSSEKKGSAHHSSLLKYW